MLCKGALKNWYFEYCEAERGFQDAKRSFELKRREICLFLFRVYAEWCRNRFGGVLRPERPAIDGNVKKPFDLFYVEFKVSSCFRDILIQLLNEAFNERFGSLSGN